MDHRLIEGLMEVIAPLIKSYVDDRIAKDVAPLHAQIAAYKAIVPEKGEQGIPGRDADPAAIAALVSREVAKAFAAIEKPADGKDVDPAEVEMLVRLVVGEEVGKIERPKDGKDANALEVAKLLADMIPVPKDGKDGVDGKSVDIQELLPVITAEVEHAVSAIAPPKDGEPGAPGVDGKSVTIDDVKPLLEEMVTALPKAENGKDADPVEVANLLVGLMPVPKDGRDGVDGKGVTLDEVAPLIEKAVLSECAKIVAPEGPQGVPGEAGKSVTVDDVRPLLDEMVAAIEPAKDGRDGKDADPAAVAALIIEDVAKMIQPPADGESVSVEDVLPFIEEMVEKRVAALPVAVNGKDGKDGKDGIGLAGALLGRAGELVMTLSDGATKDLGVVIGKDGQNGLPGNDGADGLGFDDMDATYDGERTVALKFSRGDQVKEFSFKMPIVLDRGVFKEGRDQPYEKSDGVTFGGSFWIAQKDAPEGKPQDGSKDWRLAVKRGRNGADGVVKMIPPQGPVSLAK